jgi:hypothetical protein
MICEGRGLARHYTAFEFTASWVSRSVGMRTEVWGPSPGLLWQEAGLWHSSVLGIGCGWVRSSVWAEISFNPGRDQNVPANGMVV